jgi:hypothetical protein
MTDLTQILDELRELREIISTLQPPVPPLRGKCEGLTGKGTQCRNRASPDSCYCRMHGERPPRPPKPERAPPKPKKVQPEHNHGIGEEPIEPCPLCATHGDVWDPGLTECRFIGQEINIVGE